MLQDKRLIRQSCTAMPRVHHCLLPHTQNYHIVEKDMMVIEGLQEYYTASTAR